MVNRKSTEFIVVHCSATRPSMNIGVKEITQWHKAKGWKTIGYHYVITRDGVLQTGRRENEIGAHVEGHNANSIGVCLVGGVHEDSLAAENNFTDAQFKALKTLLGFLRVKYPTAVIQGHRDFAGVNKSCPCFDVKPWVETNVP